MKKMYGVTVFMLVGMMCACTAGMDSEMKFKDTVEIADEGEVVSMRASMDKNKGVLDITPVANRDMIFEADMVIEIPNCEDASADAKRITNELGGYVQSITQSSGVFKIPLANANKALDAFGVLGVIRNKEIKAQDVTAQTTELNIRLENLEKLRQRLLDLTKQSGKLQDLLNVERELARVTQEIELYKGRLNLLKNQIDYVKISIEFMEMNSYAKGSKIFAFNWVMNLGHNIGVTIPPKQVQDYPIYDIIFPENFATIVKTRETTMMADADANFIQISLLHDQDGATNLFWKGVIEKTTKECLPLKNLTIQDAVSSEGFPTLQMSAQRLIGKTTYQYYAWAIRFDDNIYLYEAWGEIDKITPLLPELQKTFNSIDISMWH